MGRGESPEAAPAPPAERGYAPATRPACRLYAGAMRILTRVLGVVVLLLVIGLGVVWWRIDAIAESAIERGGSAALGVPTRVGLVLLRPFAGALSLTSLQIANPPDYEGSFLEVGSTRVAVDLWSLREPTLVVREVAIEDVDLLLEQRLRASNYGTILEHV